MGSNERGALISGGLTGSFWLAVLCFKLAFPNMIVPFSWALTGFAVGVVGIIVTLAFAAASIFSRHPPRRHEAILHSLADALAEVQDLALDRAWWNPQSAPTLRAEHFQKYQDALTKARRLIDQIPYDKSTTQTAKDFVQACSIAANDAQQGYNDRESRSDVARIAPGLFRFLHDGRSVRRRKVDLPDWCRFEHKRRFSEKPEPSPLILMLKRAFDGIPTTAALPKKTATQQAAEYVERITGAPDAKRGPMETSYPRVLAEAKAIGRELEGRIAYVSRILTQNNSAELRKWRSKLDLQRVPFDDLANDKLAALTDDERENVRIVVRALAELDRAVSALIAKPKRFSAAHAVGLYKQRATKARVMVGKLIKVMEREA
jgi:hypothetical protein